MAVALEREELDPAIATTSFRQGKQLLQRHLDLVLVAVLVCLTAVTRVLNLAGYPRWFTDEGVYTSQAWAVQYLHKLAPYTYWYDHPPLGWIQIDGWAVLSGAWQRNTGATIMVGREFMVFMAMMSVALTYVLAVRLGFRRQFAFMAAFLYVLSPLAVSFSRYVLLDNIVIVWLLAAMVLALSPKRTLLAAAGSGLCLGIALLSKETALFVAPAVLFLLWRNYHNSPNKAYAYIVTWGITGVLSSLYLLYALFKNELVPGAGHVSLWQGQVIFQLSSRAGSGTILNAQSDAWQLVKNAWLGLDSWLPLVGTAAILPGLFVRKLRPIAIALGVQVAWLFKGGYLPYPYIIQLLPFMALLVAGLTDMLWPSSATRSSFTVRQGEFYQRVTAGIGACLVLAMVVAFGTRGAPAWVGTLGTAFTAQQTSNQKQVLDWVEHNVIHSSRVVTEGELWLDLRIRGFVSPEVVWTYKVDTDPEVRAKFGNSIAGLDYLVLNQGTIDHAGGAYPTLAKAITGAKTIASFGTGSERIVVLKVKKPKTT